MQTIKLPYSLSNLDDSNIILTYCKQYSSCLHFMYNRVLDNISETEIKHLPMNNIDLLDSWFKQSCVKEALQTSHCNKDQKVIFGGKKNFFLRQNGKITKDEYKLLKLSPLYSIGERSNPGVKGNRKFHIEQELDTITFKPNRLTRIALDLPKLSKNYQTIFKQLYLLQEQAKTSITYKLDTKYIYISFDETVLNVKQDRHFIENRILAIDLNPNYIGWSVVDWESENNFNVIKSGVYSMKYLNDIEYTFKKQNLNSSDSKRIYINNKRRYEVLEVVKNLITTALHYKVELFCLEELNIQSKDLDKGKNFNRLCNNKWLREKLTNNLVKRCNIYNIKLQKVRCEYSSFIGNILYRHLKLPDMVLSSIEIGRRGYEFTNQYIKKNKEIKHNIISPSLEFYKTLIVKSLEEFNIKESFKNLIELYYIFKKSKIRYRLSLEELNLKFSRQKHLKYQSILI